ncbi:DNA polymerase V subunit UmuC [Aliidiomarina taiwanensis]|uniref:DNA polymerase V subunit UmuC n=1 Tax=Aliidiomarina taiwanensis TaxID=946228 RepID=A0A432WTN3_9GAMM|nr:translesion error-prone DNA polymerase V subunit UmuC [Aliidiomarina taiwanensis]RUO37141.1 DNA polymerase V subunit UmuC [Aliidiomarina taiwanensis]
MSAVFALVDCNNFYASCEKLFRPDLAEQPVVVLSNNDGCVVARSPEAKALGIKMAVPVFQIQDLIKRYGVHTFSSNYALYGDISSRVMRILEQLSPRVEVYSIDEAFLDLTGMNELEAFGMQVKQTILQWVGIHVCVGMAPTKTLAKLANHAAKAYPATGGVVDLTARTRQQKLLALLPVGEVWGVGRRLSKRLAALNIHTALDLAQSDPSRIRRQFSVVLERTVRELNGESCIALEEAPASKKQLVSSRSFGTPVTEFAKMHEALAHYTARAAEKLRHEGLEAKVLSVFLCTNRFQSEQPQYSNSATVELTQPTADTRDLTQQAVALLKRIWRNGYPYKKAGVMLADFYTPGSYTPSLFADTELAETNTPYFGSQPGSRRLMQVMDSINQSGKGRVFLTGEHLKHSWNMKREYLSPAYTTQWRQLPRVK